MGRAQYRRRFWIVVRVGSITKVPTVARAAIHMMNMMIVLMIVMMIMLVMNTMPWDLCRRMMVRLVFS